MSFYGQRFLKSWARQQAFNIGGQMFHFRRDASQTLAHNRCVTQHGIGGRKITGQIFAALKCFIYRPQARVSKRSA